MADTKGGMESSVPMIMGGRKASAFHVRNQDSRKKKKKKIVEETRWWLRQDAPFFFNSIISLLNF